MNRKFFDVATRITSLNQKDMEAVCSAIHMHYCAVLLLPNDISGAYSLLVGGIETLAQRFGEKFVSWTDWTGAEGWDKFMIEIGLDQAQAFAVRERLLDDRHLKNLKLAEAFANYASSNIPMEFWRQPIPSYEWQYDARSRTAIDGHFSEENPIHFEDISEVRQAFKAAYSIRSSFIHAGQRRVSFLSDTFLPVRPVDRPTLSIAQLRRSLRHLIENELSRTNPSLEGLENTGFL